MTWTVWGSIEDFCSLRSRKFESETCALSLLREAWFLAFPSEPRELIPATISSQMYQVPSYSLRNIKQKKKKKIWYNLRIGWKERAEGWGSGSLPENPNRCGFLWLWAHFAIDSEFVWDAKTPREIRRFLFLFSFTVEGLVTVVKRKFFPGMEKLFRFMWFKIFFSRQ